MTSEQESGLPAAVAEAMDLHRAGRLEEAERRYRALLPVYPGVADLHYGLGFLALQRGAAAEAAAHLEKARALRPGHGKTLNALGSVYLSMNRPADAQARFAESYRADPSAMVAENWAVAALHAKSAGTVLDIFDAASRAGGASPRLHVLTAKALAELGETARAAAMIAPALQATPDDPETRHVAGLIATLRVMPQEAVEHLERAAALAPTTARVHVDLGWAYIWAERAADAAEAFQAAAACADGDATILRDCAIGLERLNKLQEADALAERAAIALPWDGKLAALRSVLARREGRWQDAFDHLSPVMAEAPPEDFNVWFEWARVQDGLGAPEAAAAAFGQANAFWRKRPKTEDWAAEERAAMAGRIRDAEALPGLSPPTGLTPMPFRVIFLTGFPRSGTTLADRMLGAHSTVALLEEKPLIETVMRRVEERFGPYPACLPALAADPAEVNALREFYAEGVRRYGGAPGGVALDKHPINFWRIGLVRVLFPEAPVLALRRHPADTVLSCWQQNFRHTPTLSVFSSLPDAARAYDQWHRLVDALDRAMPLHPVVVSYEALAGNPEQTLRAILPELGLTWEEGMIRFKEKTVASAVVLSASYAQVGEGVSTKAVGKWAGYRKALADVLPVLKPWCDRFGYSI